MWIRISIFILIFSSLFPLFSQEEYARPIVEKLCHEDFYGRGYVENGVNKAAQYLKDEFQKVGLQPFFGDTTYFQDFTFDVNTFPGRMEVISDDYFYQPGIDYLVDEYSGSFNGELHLFEMDTTFIEDRSKLTLAFEEIQNGNKNGFLIDLTAISKQNRASIIYQFNGLAELAPVVYLTNEKFTWSVGKAQTNYPILYIQKNVFISAPLYIHIETEFIKDFPNVNVVGYLPSSKKNAKTIVFTAHYDHLGVMGTEPMLTFFPGGNDNASGTSMLLSLAKHYMENPSKYNIIFIAFAGEEAGLIGSHYFVENNSMNFEDIRFLINLDIMGSGEEGITVVNGKIFPKEFSKLEKINEKKNYLTQVKSRGEAANSDHYFFTQIGVPCFFIYTMGPNKNYHDVFDTYEELSFSAYDNILKLLVDFVNSF